MTTTADKIKEIEGQIEYLKRSYLEALNCLREDIEEVKSQINTHQPADHERLECWGNRYADGTAVYFSDKSYAEDVAKQSNTTRIAVHMREVTEQDEQDREDAERYRCFKNMIDTALEDRKDAARYRKAKEISRTSTELTVANVSQWDRIIDKVMEDN